MTKGVEQIKQLQVFSNGHFRDVKGTPWEGKHRSPEFKPVLNKALKGEIVKVTAREFRVVQ